jgi:hypothetical protein
MFGENLCSLRRLPHHTTTLFVTVWLLFLAGCTHSPLSPFDQASLYLPPAPASIAAANTPTFLVRNATQPFNKIGSPSAGKGRGEDPAIYVDPEKPAVYFEAQKFTTAKGLYTNLIYRIHFKEVPFGWTSLNLTAGRNPGLLFIYTLNETGTLLLITTVHTCGCYLAFFPTEAMPRQFLPRAWSTAPQSVYGYTLPSSLNIPKASADNRIGFTLESETHRISAVTVTDSATRQGVPQQVKMQLKPMLDLYSLPYQGKTVSFFEAEGSRKGYVKDNTKILERFLISWWAFDLHVGEDKAYGAHDQSDTVFYTSLKFWARKASDLKNFPQFLEYWGWQL